MVSLLTLALLCLFAFLTGLVDSIVGGGGLIQLPAMLVLLPGVPVPTVMGTSKMVGVTGTTAALRRYTRQVPLPWRSAGTAAGVAGVFSFLGARVVSHLPKHVLSPLVLGLLVLIALYTLWRKDLGSVHAPRLTPAREPLYGALVGAGIGFYDGFFGPGTGSFLLFAFVGLFGYDFLTASASAKLVNVATNVAALAYFIFTGQILWEVVVPMAACNILGAFLGAHLALRHGTGFVRVLFLMVVSAFIIKLSMQVF